MKHSIFFILSSLLILSSCTKDGNDSSASNGAQDDSNTSFSQKIENIDDKVGSISNAFIEIQKALNESEDQNKNLKNSKLSISDDFIMVFENSANGMERYEVDIRELDSKNTRLITEDEGDGFPGFSISTKGFSNIVKKSVDGKPVEDLDEFTLMFDSRERVSRIIPIFLQCINISTGEYDKYYN